MRLTKKPVLSFVSTDNRGIRGFYAGHKRPETVVPEDHLSKILYGVLCLANGELVGCAYVAELRLIFNVENYLDILTIDGYNLVDGRFALYCARETVKYLLMRTHSRPLFSLVPKNKIEISQILTPFRFRLDPSLEAEHYFMFTLTEGA